MLAIGELAAVDRADGMPAGESREAGAAVIDDLVQARPGAVGRDPALELGKAVQPLQHSDVRVGRVLFLLIRGSG